MPAKLFNAPTSHGLDDNKCLFGALVKMLDVRQPVIFPPY